ncbi:GDSL esterase/lipase [Rhynchospora pubera]|uniref:GDSL esterase/lipase n=1 Tax=Rhynchospora pubera TaxID=906938 RepID=A0AAV8H1K9_9POAL|nr:GDSL esterase/lipase [Rhynchospora pubera]
MAFPVNNRIPFVSILVLFILVSLAAGCRAEIGRVPAIYVFGDSTADVGNNNYLTGSGVAKANFPHNGIDFPSRRPTGRFSNAYNGIDFLAMHMGFKRSPPPSLSITGKSSIQTLRGSRGANFASAGSGILDTTGSTITLRKQASFIGSLVWEFKGHVEEVYNLGARKFGVVDVPPIGCCPYPRSLNPLGGCIDTLNELAQSFNQAVKDMMHGLSYTLGGFKYSIGSSYAVVQNIIKDPNALGIKEIKTACCGSGKFNGQSSCMPNSTICSNRHEFLFWDMLHPTHSTSKLAALAIYSGSQQFASPINFRQLVEDQS